MESDSGISTRVFLGSHCINWVIWLPWKHDSLLLHLRLCSFLLWLVTIFVSKGWCM